MEHSVVKFVMNHVYTPESFVKQNWHFPTCFNFNQNCFVVVSSTQFENKTCLLKLRSWSQLSLGWKLFLNKQNMEIFQFEANIHISKKNYKVKSCIIIFSKNTRNKTSKTIQKLNSFQPPLPKPWTFHCPPCVGSTPRASSLRWVSARRYVTRRVPIEASFWSNGHGVTYGKLLGCHVGR